MSKYIERKTDVNQYNFIPMCYDEIISEENPVRVIEAFVDYLDMEKLGFTKAVIDPSKPGRPPYNPKDMLKLYLYGYHNGIRSSRKLETECTRNIELFWLLGELKPDFKTIADFRKDNFKNFKKVFAEFTIICDELNLLGKKVGAIDGSKIKAVNSRRNNYTKGKLEKQIQYYQELAEKYMLDLDAEDKKEEKQEIDIKIKGNLDEIKTQLESAKKRIEELESLKGRVEKEGEISITDPDAKHMKANNKGTDIAHNTQILVDSKEHIVVAVDVTSSPADQGQLYTMAESGKKTLSVDELTVLADKGYWKGEDFKKCEENGIKAIVAKPSEQGNTGYKRSNFVYNKNEDCLVCPAGEKLYRIGKKSLKYRNTKACKACINREKCTKNKRGRTIVFNEYEEYLRRAGETYEENGELYKTRQQIVEHVFGTIKRAMGYTYFLLKGNEKVKGEASMCFLAYNIKRVCNIKSVKEIIEVIHALKQKKCNHFSCPFSIFNLIFFNISKIRLDFHTA